MNQILLDVYIYRILFNLLFGLYVSYLLHIFWYLRHNVTGNLQALIMRPIPLASALCILFLNLFLNLAIRVWTENLSCMFLSLANFLQQFLKFDGFKTKLSVEFLLQGTLGFWLLLHHFFSIFPTIFFIYKNLWYTKFGFG